MNSIKVLKKGYTILILPYSLGLIYLMTFGFGRKVLDDYYSNLIPFHSIYCTISTILNKINVANSLLDFFGNILLFVPFGFMGWISPKFLQLKILLPSFITIIFMIEIFQYFSRMGMFDVDDILLNSFGLCIGYFLKKRFF